MNALALRYLTLFLLVSSGGANGDGGQDRHKSTELMEFARVLDHSYQKGDAAALVRLAASTVGKDLWTFGRVGPYDATSLRMQALKIAKGWLFDERGVLGSEIVSRLGSLSEAEQALVQYLSVNPADNPAMVQLLSSPEPSVRWIGLYKTRFLSSPSPAIIQTLRDIAGHDDFILLTESADAREFSAPLRILANTRLQEWNEQEIPEDKPAIARAGLKKLLKEYSDHPDRRLTIAGTVEQFNTVFSPIARTELDRLNGDTPEEQQTLDGFRQSALAHEQEIRDWQTENGAIPSPTP